MIMNKNNSFEFLDYHQMIRSGVKYNESKADVFVGVVCNGLEIRFDFIHSFV